MTSGLPLRSALALLRDELALAQSDRGARLGLRVDAIELDLALELDADAAIEAEAGVEGKVPWLVVGKARSKASAKATAAYTHRIQLAITPLDLEPGGQTAVPDAVGAEDPRGPGVDEGELTPAERPQPGPLVVGDAGLRRDPVAESE